MTATVGLTVNHLWVIGIGLASVQPVSVAAWGIADWSTFGDLYLSAAVWAC